MKIIDISSHQSVETAGMDGIDAVIVKATQGTGYVNPKCDPQYQTAKAKGRLLGVYHYAGGGNPVAEADYFLENVKGYIGEAVLALDWEAGQNASWGDTNWCSKFVDRVHEKTGIYPLIYVQASAINQVANLVNRCGLWVAGYPTNAPGWNIPNFTYNIAPWKAYTIWQFTSSNETLDLNTGNLDAAAWKRIAGNKSTAPTPPVNPTPPVQPTGPTTQGKNLEVLAGEVQKGVWGDGDNRKKALGDRYDGVQAIVNHRTNPGGLQTATIERLRDLTIANQFRDGDSRKFLLGSYYETVQRAVNEKLAAKDRVYTVVAGDSLSGIGVKVNVPWLDIARRNGIPAPYVIQIGQKLRY